MRRSASGTRALFGWLALAAAAPAAWAYINGGDFHDTRKTFAQSLKAGGWAFCLNEGTGDGIVNVLVGRAVLALPTDERGKVPVEVKRAVARLAEEAIKAATSSGKEVVREGRIGAVLYRVGVHRYETYWETNYGKKREVHARRTGLAPFVALKVQEPPPPKGDDEK